MHADKGIALPIPEDSRLYFVDQDGSETEMNRHIGSIELSEISEPHCLVVELPTGQLQVIERAFELTRTQAAWATRALYDWSRRWVYADTRRIVQVSTRKYKARKKRK